MAGHDGVARALAHAARARPRRERALAELVAIPSVSSDRRRAADVARAARAVARLLADAGLERVRLLPGARGPLVLAEHRRRAAGRAPCLLIYGHYDVVPAGGGWTATAPFAPLVRDGFLYGRGASDDKGPALCHVAALEAWLRATGRLPVDVVCVFDGEEEVGSPTLRALLRRRGDALGATAAVVSDTRTLGPDRPTLVTALRGSLVGHVRVTGPRADLHSGQHGGVLAGPAEVVARLIASLHAPDGSVAVRGFYAGARRAAPAERARLRRVAPGDRAVLAHAGVAAGAGEPGWGAFERATLRPSLTVARLAAGAKGADSVIPARAEATISLRLVPGQQPMEIAQRVRDHLARRVPPGLRLDVAFGKASRPWSAQRDAPVLTAAERALAASFPRPPARLPSGGTIPVVSALHDAGLPVALMGFARPDDGMHGADERVDLTVLARGTAACVRFLAELGAGSPRQTAW
jgi:acetylornithine deacetylase/succinyl-diaminopimelate desuccinylase-like protein